MSAMKIKFDRDEILRPLATVASVVERRQTLPILSFALLRNDGEKITLAGTDLEIEVITQVGGSTDQQGALTIPARKLLDICRALPEGASIQLEQDAERVRIKAGKSRFSLVSLPAGDFPILEVKEPELTLKMEQAELLRLLNQTHFCMAQQDVRYYLNGLLLELSGKRLRSVATDGHRMAVSDYNLPAPVSSALQVILPRKAVHEITRLLGPEGEIELRFCRNHLQLQLPGVSFSAKLIDGRFPDYTKVIPTGQTKKLQLQRSIFKDALSRVAILSNEKYRGVRFSLGDSTLTMTAHNPEQEEALEELNIEYSGEPFEIGFNVTYISEATTALDSEEITLGLSDPNSSCTITAPGTETQQYVVMPMRL
jgi:DNA polymerase-3 subunit beta